MLCIAAPMRVLTAFQNTANNAAGVPQATTKVLTLTGVVLPVGILMGVLQLERELWVTRLHQRDAICLTDSASEST
jgi:hypothetical protein